MNSDVILVLTAFVAGALSFLSVGILWTGMNQWAQSLSTLLFLLLGYFAAKKAPARSTILATVIGAAPLGYMMTLFRDKNDSHLLGISIVTSWILAVSLGALCCQWSSKKNRE